MEKEYWITFKRRPWPIETINWEKESMETLAKMKSPLIENKTGPFESRSNAERAAIEILKRDDVDPGSIRISNLLIGGA